LLVACPNVRLRLGVDALKPYVTTTYLLIDGDLFILVTAIKILTGRSQQTKILGPFIQPQFVRQAKHDGAPQHVATISFIYLLLFAFAYGLSPTFSSWIFTSQTTPMSETQISAMLLAKSCTNRKRQAQCLLQTRKLRSTRSFLMIHLRI
jgi:hypothetical protein